MAILDDVKISLRITSTAYNTEITDLIAACKKDLEVSGVANIDDTEVLVKRAIMTYCKCNFGFDNPDYDKLYIAYEKLKNLLVLSIDYNTEVVESGE
jgi:hypothetical protein